ncbi:MAG: hypothetical protein IPJ76_07315 [Flavobacteriales bacterium]|nr:MAG: hypothetical protein IPJ76_07315 [Flavobacteriales bacterium]
MHSTSAAPTEVTEQQRVLLLQLQHRFEDVPRSAQTAAPPAGRTSSAPPAQPAPHATAA